MSLNITNLYYYINQWLFFKNQTTQQSFDLIVSHKSIPNAPKNFVDLSLQNLQFGISGALLNLLSNAKNALVILDELNLFYLIPFFKKSPKTSFTILNLGSWISSVLNKDYTELDDIAIAKHFGLPVYEPIDLVHFFKILSYKHSKIIRIPNKDLPTNISQHFKVSSWQKTSLLGPDQTRLEWNCCNILAHSYLFDQLIQLHKIFEEQKKLAFNGFLITNREFNNLSQFDETFKKLPTILILDQLLTPTFAAWLEKKFQKTPQLHFVQPHIPTTLQPERVWHQAQLEAPALAKKIFKAIF